MRVILRYYCRISVQGEGGERGHRVLSALQDGEGAHRGLEYGHLILHQVSLPGISIHFIYPRMWRPVNKTCEKDVKTNMT